MVPTRRRQVLLVALLLCCSACQDGELPDRSATPGSGPSAVGVSSTPAPFASARSKRRAGHRPPRPASSARRAPVERPEPVPFDAAELEVIRAPAKPACTFETSQWRPPRDAKAALRIHPKAPPFAHVVSGQLRLLVPAGAAQDGIVEVTRGGITLRGRVRSDDATSSGKPRHRRPIDKPFLLRPARPFALGEVLAVTAQTKLAWRAAKTGQLTVTVPESRLRWKPAAELDRPCDDLSLDEPSFDHAALLPAVPKDAPKRYLRMGRPLAIRAAAYEPTIATLHLPSGEGEALELERSGGRVRILLEHDNEVIFGWVSTRELLDDELGALLGMGALGLQGIGDGGWGALEPMRPSMAQCTCAKPVRIVADMSKRAPHPELHQANYAVVGEIPAQQPFRALKGEGELWRLHLRAVLTGIRLARGQLAVLRSDVDGCSCTAGRRGF